MDEEELLKQIKEKRIERRFGKMLTNEEAQSLMSYTGDRTKFRRCQLYHYDVFNTLIVDHEVRNQVLRLRQGAWKYIIVRLNDGEVRQSRDTSMVLNETLEVMDN